jgi:hypothetical protein
VVADPAVGVALDQVEGRDDLAWFDLEARLFPDLAARRLGQRLAELLSAARQAPLALARRLVAPDQEHPIAVPHDHPDAYDRARRILAAVG